MLRQYQPPCYDKVVTKLLGQLGLFIEFGEQFHTTIGCFFLVIDVYQGY